MIAFIGTGILGSALAEAAARRGDHVTVWNRTAGKARALEQFGVRVASTPAEAVRDASRVHLVLKDDIVVDDVIEDLKPGLDPRTVVIDHTTTLPALTAQRSRRLDAEGVRYLHCPVFIGPTAARQGKGTILACGSRALFDTVHGDLARMAARVEYLGERPDIAAVYKLCGNTLIVGVTGLLADVITIASANGIAPTDILGVTEFFSIPGVVEGRGRHMAAGNFKPSFELAMARKDVQLMLDAAGDRPLAALPAIAARMDTLLKEGYENVDMTILGIEALNQPKPKA